MPHNPDALADMVILTIQAALAPILERVAEQSAQVKQALAVEAAVTSLRERLVVLETKGAAPVVAPEPLDLSPVLERLAATEARVARLAAVELSVGELHDKCVTLETKAAIPPQVPPPPDLRPLTDRLFLAEGSAADLSARVTQLETRGLETKAAPVATGPSPAELELLMRDAIEPLKTTVATLHERIAVLEVPPLLPGPAGKDGAPGAQGHDGKDGRDGISLDDLSVVQHEDERTFTIRGTVGNHTKDLGIFKLPVQIPRGVYVNGKTYDRGDCVAYGGWWQCNETTSNKPGDGTKAWTLIVRPGRDGKDGKDAETVPVVHVSPPPAMGRR